MIWPDPTHKPTHPPTHPWNYTPTHGWGSLHRFQIFKQNWNISISSSTIEFWFIPGVPHPGGWCGGWMGVGVGDRIPPAHVHMHTCACMCTHVWHHRESLGFPQIQWGQPFAWNYHVYHACMCVCVCMHAHACAHVWGAPRNHPPPHPPSPPTPRAAGSPKHQNSISLELIKIIRFCLKILYLWTFLNSYRL